MHRISVAALVTAIAVPSTPLSAQVTEPAPTLTETPPSSDPAPVSDAPAEPATSTADTTASGVQSETAAQPVKTAKKPLAKANAAKVQAPKPVVAPVVRAAPVPAPKADPIEPLPSPTAQALQGANEAQSMPIAADTSASESNSDAVAFGGALALLVIGAGAMGVARRRKRVADSDSLAVTDEVAEPMVRRESDLSPPVVAATPVTERSAFAWGNPPAHQPSALTPIQRAHRGPTPDNPSMSLKRRLKRAAFFEQRERDAAAGRAAPVSRWAGLPDALVDSGQTRNQARQTELQPA